MRVYVPTLPTAHTLVTRFMLHSCWGAQGSHGQVGDTYLARCVPGQVIQPFRDSVSLLVVGMISHLLRVLQKIRGAMDVKCLTTQTLNKMQLGLLSHT